MNWSEVKEFYIGGREIKEMMINNQIVWRKNSSLYINIVPADLNFFPITLNNFISSVMTYDMGWSTSSSYLGSIYTSNGFPIYAIKLGRAFSNYGNYITDFDDYQKGDIAIGFSSHVDKSKAFNFWQFSNRPSSNSIKEWFQNHTGESALKVLAEAYYPREGYTYVASKRTLDDALGYYCEEIDDFCIISGMEESI